MTEDEKITFIITYLNQTAENLCNKVDKMPEEWNGVELRWLIAETFTSEVIPSYRDKRSSRYRSYENTCITKNI